jgi:hypothetical protein
MLFDRVCNLVIGTANTQGFLFNQDFRITFDIQKSSTNTPKQSKIEIYNLSQETRDALQKLISSNNDNINNQQIVMLYAGYSFNVGAELLYSGNITNISSKKEPPDVVTTISCAENSLIYKNSFSSLSYGGGITSKKVIEDIAAQMKVDIDENSNFGTGVTLAHGWTHAGLSKQAMDKITRQAGLTWSTQNGKIRVVPQGSSTNDEVVIVVSPTSGMIGSPERKDNSGDDTDNPAEKHGWSVKSLLQPKLSPNRKVKIESMSVDGVYIIDTVSHRGDTKSGDWQTEFEVKDKQVAG